MLAALRIAAEMRNCPDGTIHLTMQSLAAVAGKCAESAFVEMSLVCQLLSFSYQESGEGCKESPSKGVSVTVSRLRVVNVFARCKVLESRRTSIHLRVVKAGWQKIC